jgi:predicted nucleic acid-binding protein
MRQLEVAGDSFLVPAVSDYEVRREYLRRGSIAGLHKLDTLLASLVYLPFPTEGWRRASELWAWARNHGHITAPATDLNIDLLLAAQAQLINTPDTPVIIATTNVRHLAPFADARLWTEI